MIDIWVDNRKKKKIISKINGKPWDGSMVLIETNSKIAEAYFEEDGTLYMHLDDYEDKGLGFSVHIPFQDWFYQAVKFNWFDDLERFLREHEEETNKIWQKVNNIRLEQLKLKNKKKK